MRASQHERTKPTLHIKEQRDPALLKGSVWEPGTTLSNVDSGSQPCTEADATVLTGKHEALMALSCCVWHAHDPYSYPLFCPQSPFHCPKDLTSITTSYFPPLIGKPAGHGRSTKPVGGSSFCKIFTEVSDSKFLLPWQRSEDARW